MAPNPRHGFPQATWDAAKKEAKDILIARATVRGMIPYSELVGQLKTIPLLPHDQRLSFLLDEISREENQAGRGMLTVVVVHKLGDMQPGPGFFELAKSLGRNVSDVLVCWVEELHRVHGHWSK